MKKLTCRRGAISEYAILVSFTGIMAATSVAALGDSISTHFNQFTSQASLEQDAAAEETTSTDDIPLGTTEDATHEDPNGGDIRRTRERVRRF